MSLTYSVAHFIKILDFDFMKTASVVFTVPSLQDTND